MQSERVSEYVEYYHSSNAMYDTNKVQEKPS